MKVGDTVMTLQGPKVILSMNDEVVRFEGGFAPIDRVSEMCTSEQRIKNEAAWVADTTSSNAWEMRRMRIIYEKAAKSERNKTIDEAIDIVTDYQDYNPLIIERLKAMKI